MFWLGYFCVIVLLSAMAVVAWRRENAWRVLPPAPPRYVDGRGTMKDDYPDGLCPCCGHPLSGGSGPEDPVYCEGCNAIL